MLCFSLISRGAGEMWSRLSCSSRSINRSRELKPSLFVVRSSRPLFRSFNSSEVQSGSNHSKTWKAPEPRNERRIAESRITRPGLSTTSILEGKQDDETQVESEQESEEEVTLKTIFYQIIQDGQPENVMNVLLDPRFEHLVGSLPHTIFVEVFNLLSPAYFVEPYRQIHRPLHPSAVEVKGYRSLDSIFDEFVNNLATVVNIRQAAGKTLGLAEYTHLLDCARSIGDVVMAESIWHNMKEDDVFPDIRCYNFYMEAKVWDTAFTGREKYHLRMTPYAYRKRRFSVPNAGWQGYGTAGRSVRKEVLEIFNEMTDQGIHGDEATFINVFLASSRVGHVKGMKNILKTVWNIDMDALLENVDESTLPAATFYDPSSPLHPTDRLLFAIAHGFGTNNDLLPAALKAIDFISRSYDLKVTEKVWLELFERSFVLSRRRFGPDAKRNAKGKVSFEFLSTMFQTMTSEPFHCRPTIEIHHMLAKTAWDRARLSEFNHHMDAAYNILKETKRKLKTARTVLEGYLGSLSQSRKRKQIDPDILNSKALADAINTYDILRLRTAQQTIIMERLARLLLIHHRWTGRDNPVWERRLLPTSLEEWQDFLPKSFVYYTSGGLVQFEGVTKWRQSNLTGTDKAPVRRLTTEEDVGLASEVEELDDSFFWEKYRQAFPALDMNIAPLNRLNWLQAENQHSQIQWPRDDIDIQPDALQIEPDEKSTSRSNAEDKASHSSLPDDFTLAIP